MRARLAPSRRCCWRSPRAAARRQTSPDRARRRSSDGELSGTLTVFAAASLTDVFGELGDQLTADNPDLDVQFNFAGSSALATQIVEGAPADVFASANQTQMTVVTDEDLQAAEPGGLHRERAADRRPGRQPGRDHRASRTSPARS